VQTESTEQATTVEPEQDNADLLPWLRQLRADVHERYGHRVGGHDAHLDDVAEATR
jgi:hypothetical protein